MTRPTRYGPRPDLDAAVAAGKRVAEQVKKRLQEGAMSAIDHPQHYTPGKIEVIDAIEDWKLGFNLGNVVKYIVRAGRKDPTKTLEDLAKGRWYLDREIARLQKVDLNGGQTVGLTASGTLTDKGLR